MSDKFLVPGAKVRLTLKSNVRCEGKLVSVDEDGKITLGHVVSFGTTVEQSRPSTAAEHVIDEHVVFQRSDLKEVTILVKANPSPSDSTTVEAVEATEEEDRREDRKLSDKRLVPGAKIRLISKAEVRYEGQLASVDDKEGKIALERVLAFHTSEKTTPSSNTAAEQFACGYVIFRQSELKEVSVLDNDNTWPTDPAVISGVENRIQSSVTVFSNQLLTWVQKEENEKVNLALDNSDLHHSFDATEKTLLHYAVKYKNATIVEKLLSISSNVNAQDWMGTTPLMMAMVKQSENGSKDWAIMKMLLAAGADVLILNKERKSALHVLCANYEDYDLVIKKKFFENIKKKCPCSNYEVDILIDAGCSLRMAYEYLKDLRTVELLLQRGLPVVDLSEEFVFHFAIKQQDVECVQLLLKYGASVHEKDELGDTPWSCFTDYDMEPENEARIVQLLLQHGASPTTCITGGIFQAVTTLQSGQKEAIRALLQYNLDFTATDECEKECVLHYLAVNTNTGIVEELQCCTEAIKVAMNIRDRKGHTPLHSAAQWANVNMLAFLLSMGAEVDCQTTKGLTPLYYNCKVLCDENLEDPRDPKHYDLCAELLLQHYANPQFVVTEANGDRVTFFEAASIAKNVIRAEPFVAQLAILEGHGTEITEIIQGKISLYPALQEYLNGCRRLLQQEISGSVTLLKLLPGDKKKMARFLEYEEFVLELKGFMERLKSSCFYYYNWLKVRYSEGAQYKILKGKAAQVICSIFKKNVGENVNANNLIIDRIIEFLDEKSLMDLSKV